ncbi:MAG: hypothetical protein ACLQU2_13645 [Candidatus Binataceae bacterium]
MALEFPGGLAVDGAGNVWVTNYHDESLSEPAGSDSSAPGAPITPSTGYTDEPERTICAGGDASGNVWAANFGNNTVT